MAQCGTISGITYDCTCKNQWAANSPLNACLCDGSYVEWGLDPANIDATGGLNPEDCLMLPNLNVSGYLEATWSNSNAYQGLGYALNLPQIATQSDISSFARLGVRSAIYNSGHGPIYIAGEADTGIPNTYNTTQVIYAKKADGTQKTYFRNTGLIAQLHPTHEHIHIENFFKATLRADPGTGAPISAWPVVRESNKISYCIEPTNTCNLVNASGTTLNNYCSTIPSMSDFENYDLGNVASNCHWNLGPAVMTLNPGKVDVYTATFDGQGIYPAGLCPGDYHLILEVDPGNHFVESNEDDNITDMGIFHISTTTVDDGTGTPHLVTTINDMAYPEEILINPSVGYGISWWGNHNTENIIIGSTIRIPSGKVLHIKDKEIQFTENAKIIVERGAELHLENARLVGAAAGGCTDGTWQGIEVWGNPNISQEVVYTPNSISPSNPGTYSSEGDEAGLVLMQGSTISDAQIGILAAKQNADGSIDRNYVGGVVIIDDDVTNFGTNPARNTFSNNYTDISLDYRRSTGITPPTPAHADYITGKIISYIADADFVRDDDTKFGIYLNYVDEISLSNCTFANKPLSLKKNKGIRAIHSGLQAAANSFESLAIGISKYSTTASTKKGKISAITGNHFNRTNKGIYLYGGYADKIQNNLFTDIPHPSNFGLSNTPYDTYGVYIVNSNLFVAIGNIFEGAVPNPTTTSTCYSFGLITNGTSERSGHVIKENHFSQTDYGLSMQGANPYLQIDCNLFGRDQQPHRISAWAIPDGLVGEQGSDECTSTSPADNEWQYPPDECTAVQDLQIGTDVAPFLYHAHAPDGAIRTIPNIDECVAEDNINIQQCPEYKSTESCATDDLMLSEGSPEEIAARLVQLDAQIASLDQQLADNDAQDQLLAWIEDGGNPEGVAALIDNPLLPDALLVTALNAIDQLSKEAQLKVVNRSVPLSSQQLRSVLLQCSPLPDEVLKALAERVVPLATAVMQDLKEAQSYMPDVPNREVLRRQSQTLHHQRGKANALKVGLLLLLDHDATLLALLQDHPTDLAQYYLAQGNAAQAQAALSAIPSNDDYAALLHIAADLLSDNTTQPDADQIAQLQALAQSPDEQAAMEARNWLCAAADSIYEHPIRKISTSSGKMAYVECA